MGREGQSRRLEVESTGSGRPRHWVGDRFLSVGISDIRFAPGNWAKPDLGEEKSKVESRI